MDFFVKQCSAVSIFWALPVDARYHGLVAAVLGQALAKKERPARSPRPRKLKRHNINFQLVGDSSFDFRARLEGWGEERQA